MTGPSPSALLAPLFSSPAMRAVLDDRARLQRMLDVEAALTRAEAALGVIPAGAAGAITAACRAELYDVEAIGLGAPAGGNLAIPLVKALTAEVRKKDEEAARFVHWGATSQDIVDTALMLDLRAAIDVLLVDLDKAIAGFAALAGKHRRTLMVARTLLQHALPMPFGLKLAGFAAALDRARERLKRLRREALVLQFGGAAGTLAALGERGLDVSERLAALLDLPLPDAPWFTHRDRVAEIGASFAILCGTCGKIARDVSLLMQTDVAEAFEPAEEGRGTSSTMPHKRNPTGAALALAAASMAPQLAATLLVTQVQEHERAAGAWQAEWPTLVTLTLATSSALGAVADMAQGLEVDGERMKANLDTTRGLIMAEAVSFALAGKIGKAAAHTLIERASQKAVKEKRHLRDVLIEDKDLRQHVGEGEILKLMEPSGYQGVAQAFIERQVAPLLAPQRNSKRH